jgi:poly(A) polymerase
MSSPEAVAVFAALDEGGAKARFVGGCVRDAVLERPIRDIDLATDAPPERVVELLEAARIKVIPTGIAHGTVTAVVEEKPVEITTLRRDVETYGRHAKVEFTDDWIEDASRRDFTINALSLDPDGTLHDPFDGLKDLSAHHVRFVGGAMARISEDVLRLLRYFRFFAHYGRPPADLEALAACREMAPRLSQLSAERVRAELLKILEAPTAADVMGLMHAEGIFEHFLPEATNFYRLSRLIELETTLELNDPIRRLAAVLMLDETDLDALSKRLRLSNVQGDRLTAIVEHCPVIKPTLGEAERDALLYRIGVPTFFDGALVCWAGADIDDGWKTLVAACRNWHSKKFPLRGDDVMALGAASGPSVGVLFRAVEEWWIDGGFRADREACMERLKVLIKQSRG